MTKKRLSNSQADALTNLIKKTIKFRDLQRKAEALKKECEVLVLELTPTAKENKNSLSNGEHVISFKLRKGGEFFVPKWSKFGVDKITKL